MKRNLGEMGRELSHWSLKSDMYVNKYSLTLCEGKEGGWYLRVLGEGQTGVKVRKKGRQRQAKKVKKRGRRLAEWCSSSKNNLSKPYYLLWQIDLCCSQVVTSDCAQTVRVATALGWSWDFYTAVTNSASQFCPFQWDLPSVAKHKPSSVAAADVNRHLATAFWCKSSSADTVFKRDAQKESGGQGGWGGWEGDNQTKREIYMYTYI